MTRETVDRLCSRLRAAWGRSDALFGLLQPDALGARPIRLRQPFVFYLGHLPAFAWNQVGRGVLGRPSFHPEFDVLFERGIDPPDEDAPEAADRESWPSEKAILAYRDGVRHALLGSFDAVAARAGEDVLAEKGRIFRLVIEHELMHQETLLYMLQELPHERKRPPADAVRPAEGAGANGPALERGWVDVPAGGVTLGASFEALDFGWDNEFPPYPVDVARFSIETMPVRNRDFVEFVADGGYERRELWASASWSWRAAKGMQHPHGWQPADDGWTVRTVFRNLPFAAAADWPVQVSWAEAYAYARWRGLRLPTEAEVHRAACGTPEGEERRLPWGDQDPRADRGNFDFRRWTPAPAGTHPRGASAWGVHELVGNGWEWTSSPFEPFPGFEAYARTYPGYSKDFFDGLHYVLTGASWATDVALIRRSFRNWFQPNYPYVFAKFRCVRPG